MKQATEAAADSREVRVGVSAVRQGGVCCAPSSLPLLPTGPRPPRPHFPGRTWAMPSCGHECLHRGLVLPRRGEFELVVGGDNKGKEDVGSHPHAAVT